MTATAGGRAPASLRERRGVVRGRRQAVLAEGPETEAFLQGQLSQDVTALARGETAPSLLLHPNGKIAAWLRVTRLGDTRFLLDVDAGFAEAVVARLERFKLRTACDLSIADWQCVTAVGPGADQLAVGGDVVHRIEGEWAGVPVVDHFGPAPTFDEADLVDKAALEALRIEAGVPKMGAELDESTIPAAAGVVDESVSFTKGCYTGQELVARIDSRGSNVPRRLVGLVLTGSGVPDPGTALQLGETDAGAITSAALSPTLGPVALAYVSRKVGVGDTVRVGSRESVVRELPLVRG